MSESPIEDDQEIAENMQNRIFYEESTHERVIQVLRYKDQGFGYLEACTELSHVFLRMLERYSKQNIDLQVRSRRRARKRRNKAAQAQGEGNVDDNPGDEAEDVVEAERTSKERTFDFQRFSARFVNQTSVNTFVAFTRHYHDLTAEQLKRAHRFLYRVAFKMELSILLYRVDILHLFNKMIKGPEGLDPEAPIFKEWKELVRQVFRGVIKKVQKRPEILVEMLFSKINGTIYYLEHGYEKEIPVRQSRLPAELTVKGGLDIKDQIGIAVLALISEGKVDSVRWLKDAISAAATEREAWELEREARTAVQGLPQAEAQEVEHERVEDSNWLRDSSISRSDHP
jgi:replication fork protection complex subunit Tof1/Swi1